MDDIYELPNYPAKGFAFQLRNSSDLERISQQVHQTVQHLYSNQIAHNVFITRGEGFDVGQKDEVIRIIIWARPNIVGKIYRIIILKNSFTAS